MAEGTSTTTGSSRVASGILVSRLTGLARERAIGHFLGTSAAADAFAVAVRVPNLLQHLLGEGVLSASFIPVLTRLLDDGRDEEAGRVAGAVLGLLALVTGVLAIVGVLAAEPLATVVATGLRSRPETFALTVTMIRILFPATGLLVLSAWCLGVLNSHRRFFVSYVAPAALNLTQVAVLVVAAAVVADVGATATTQRLALWLAAGTVLGGGLQLAVQAVAVRRLHLELVPSLQHRLAGVRETITAFLPVVTARGAVQVSTFVHVFLASFLAAGALAALRYAQVLYALPVALFGMAVAAAELPELSTQLAPGAATARLQAGLRQVALLVVPTVLGYLVLGDVLVAALFRSGRFGVQDVQLVQIVLAGYALALPASTAARLLQSALYGAGHPRIPSRVAVLRVAVSAAVGAALMVQLDRVVLDAASGLTVTGSLPAIEPLTAEARTVAGDRVRLGALGLSLGGAVGAWLELVILRREVGRLVGPVQLGGGAIGRILAATAVAAVPAVLLRRLVTTWPPVLAAVVAVVVVAGTYLAVASRLGLGGSLTKIWTGLRDR